MSGRKPNYRIGIMDKKLGVKNNSAGAAWLNNDGTISLVIEGFVEVRGGPDLLITLFPIVKDRPNVLSNPDNASSKPPPLQDH